MGKQALASRVVAEKPVGHEEQAIQSRTPVLFTRCSPYRPGYVNPDPSPHWSFLFEGSEWDAERFHGLFWRNELSFFYCCPPPPPSLFLGLLTSFFFSFCQQTLRWRLLRPLRRLSLSLSHSLCVHVFVLFVVHSIPDCRYPCAALPSIVIYFVH
eukprot:RCo004340